MRRADLPARPRDDRHGRPERDARLVLGRRPLRATPMPLVGRGAARCSRGGRATCSTSAASRRARAPRRSRRRGDRARRAGDRGAREAPSRCRSRSTRARRPWRAAALAAGARLVNDVSGGAARSGARSGRGRVRRGAAARPPARRARDDAAGASLRRRGRGGRATSWPRRRARGSGRRARERIAVDPGIGFGKTLEHNLALLANAGTIAARLGRPVLVGPSRKSFLGRLTGDPVEGRDAPPWPHAPSRSSRARTRSASTTSRGVRAAAVAGALARRREQPGAAALIDTLSGLISATSSPELRPGARHARHRAGRARGVLAAAADPRHARGADPGRPAGCCSRRVSRRRALRAHDRCTWILDNFLSSAVLIIIVLFQADIRRALARVGRGVFPSVASARNRRSSRRSCARRRRSRSAACGALIVLERETHLEDLIEAGTPLDAARRRTCSSRSSCRTRRSTTARW